MRPYLLGLLAAGLALAGCTTTDESTPGGDEDIAPSGVDDTTVNETNTTTPQSGADTGDTTGNTGAPPVYG